MTAMSRLPSLICLAVFVGACGRAAESPIATASQGNDIASEVAITVRGGNGSDQGSSAMLSQYERTFDHLINASEGLKARVSFPDIEELVARIDQLDSNFLRTRRETLKQAIHASPASSLECLRILIVICSQLVDADTIIAITQELPIDPKTARLRSLIVHHFLGVMKGRRLYREIVRQTGVIQDMLAFEVSHEHLLTTGRLPQMGSFDESVAQEAAALYEALLGVGDNGGARRFADWITSVSPRKKTFEGLIEAAEIVAADSEVERLEAAAAQLASPKP
jgi:hypothetical protein